MTGTMRRCTRAAATVGMAAAVIGTLAPAPLAQAADYGIELNGTYSALSIGNFAKTNEVFIDEPVVRAVWTITTTCTSPTKCTGQVVSNQGWTEPIRYTEDRWEVFHDIPGWIPCPDGSTAPGRQAYIFAGRDANGQNDGNPNLLGGTDTTVGPSGACGRNLPVEKVLPFRLEKLPQ